MSSNTDMDNQCFHIIFSFLTFKHWHSLHLALMQLVVHVTPVCFGGPSALGNCSITFLIEGLTNLHHRQKLGESTLLLVCSEIPKQLTLLLDALRNLIKMGYKSSLLETEISKSNWSYLSLNFQNTVTVHITMKSLTPFFYLTVPLEIRTRMWHPQ